MQPSSGTEDLCELIMQLKKEGKWDASKSFEEQLAKAKEEAEGKRRAAAAEAQASQEIPQHGILTREQKDGAHVDGFLYRYVGVQ